MRRRVEREKERETVSEREMMGGTDTHTHTSGNRVMRLRGS